MKTMTRSSRQGLKVEIVATLADTTPKPDRDVTQTTEIVYTTDDAGRIEVSYTAADPDSDDAIRTR